MPGPRTSLKNDAFVTGLGIVSPAGSDYPLTWSILTSYSCNVFLTDPEPLGSYEGFLDVLGFTQLPHPPGEGTPSRCRALDPTTRLALAAADQAVAAARLAPDDCRAIGPRPARVSVGTSKGGVITAGQALAAIGRTRQGGNHHVEQTLLAFLREGPPDAAARLIAERFGATGGTHATVGACATGTLAVIQAARWIQDGEADIVLAGSADACKTPLWLAAFQRMGVLARPHPTLGPAYACRPFDRSREGFVVSEGAAILVLESRRSVQKRSIEPLARIAAFASGSDPAGLVNVDGQGEALAAVVTQALRRGGYKPRDLAAVLAHGTATPANDATEVRALRRALGNEAPRVPIVSVKGVIGHLLGAAGSVETALAALATHHRRLPGNATLIEPDPAFEDLTLPRQPVDLPSGPILKTSMGFGGHLAAILLDNP